MTQPDPNAQGGTGTAQSGGDGGQGTGTGETGAQSGTGETGQQTSKTYSQQEWEAQQQQLEQLRARMQAADQRAGKAENDLKQLRDKDMPELQKLQRDLQDVTTERDQLKETLKATRLENAFLSDNTIKWRNPKTALKLADLTNVTIDDDGKVNGLVPALQALAKSDAYLVDDGASSGDGDGGNDGSGSKGSTGATGAGGRQQETKTDMKKMATRFPALRSRGLGQ